MRQFLCSIWNTSLFARACYSTAAKGQLATLRKQTGYSIKNCKNALDIHGNDLEAAVKWLNDEARKQGWEKATKLQNRTTIQGLIGIHVQNKTAALVEVCCETDFVAKNDIFKSLVKTVATTCCVSESKSTELFSEEHLEPNLMNCLRSDGKSLKDHVAEAISHLGENIVLKRGLLLHSDQDVLLTSSVHPNTGETTTPLIGTYGALVALKMSPDCVLKKESLSAMGQQLCMHIIGMKPKSIRQTQDEKPDIPAKKNLPVDENEEEYETEAPEKDYLLGQGFVFNAELTVGEILQENGLEVVHFVRMERGETANESAV